MFPYINFCRSFSLYVALCTSLRHFTTITSACYVFDFQPSDQTIFLWRTSRLEHKKSLSENYLKSGQTGLSDPTPDQSTTDHRQTRRPHQTLRLDHHRYTRPPKQITSPEHTPPFLTTQLPISTAYPAS